MNFTHRFLFLTCLLPLIGCSTSEKKTATPTYQQTPKIETIVGAEAEAITKLLLADPKDRLHLAASRPNRIGYTKFPCYQFEVPAGLYSPNPNAAYRVSVNGKQVVFSAQYGTTALACRRI